MSKRNGASSRQSRSYEELLRDDPDKITLLDRALEGASDQQKARVRGVLRRLEIEDDDEFYIIITAIGYLMVLVEDAPENWRGLFDDFEEKLDAWSQQNVRTLEAIYQQADNTDRMAKCFRRLADSTTQLSSETKASLTRLTKLNGSLDSLTGKLNRAESHSQQLAQMLQKSQLQLERLERRVTWTSSFSLAALVVLIVGGGFSYLRLAHTSERAQWLLEKANRAECLSGIKPSSDSQCQ
ncbi:DUF6753 family protein [Synechococcus sp. PCC 7335]|uniref:DUF6753 family protein n=1 Tax=Synechococcus sp. (strain ATCC 29403 / PCC 7335) TaxID=91464 RepID=UPI00056E4692|nr:DUF6753 family protein [Synechococcus sp. PCC 7335]